MITETAIDKLIQPLLDRQTQIEMAIIQKIAKRVGEIKTMLPSDIFRLERLFKTGSDVREINKELARLTKLQQKDIKKIIKTVAGDAYADAKPYYDYRNKPFIPYGENEELQKAIQAVERVTLQDFDNLANATAFMMRDPARGNFLFPTSVSKTYQSVIDLAIQAATFNSASYNTLIPKAIKELVNSGMKTVEYNPESGKKHTVRLDTAVRRNILDGIRNVNQTVQNITGEQFGSDGKEISVHNMSAPDHEPIQGHQFTNEQIDNMQTGKAFVDVDGTGFAPIDRPIGLWNCRHLMLNIIVGVFKPLYTKEQLERIKENNAKGYTYINSKGEKVTKSKYWCTQRMRDYELDIKKAKEGKEAAALAKEPDIEAQYQAKITQKQNEYTQFCKACGLKPRYENTRIYTADNQIKSVDKIAESGIIKPKVITTGELGVRYIGNIDKNIFEKEFGTLRTDEVVLTEERIQHIKDGHSEDYDLFEKYNKEILESPDIVIKDGKNDNTVFMIKHIDETNMNIVLKLAVFEDEKHPKNSIMTAYRIRDKNVRKLEKKNKTLYKRE